MSSFEEKYRPKSRGDGMPAVPAFQVLKEAADARNQEDIYSPFYTQAQPQFDLWIRPNEANASPAISLPYSRRSSMTADDGFFVIGLQFDSGPVLSVRLHGRNLEELYMKLLAHQVVYVREYDVRKWPVVPEGEACITGIDVRYRPEPRGKDAALAEQDREPLKASTH